MILTDVVWGNPVNILVVRCEPCVRGFLWPSNVSLVQCPDCKAAELWHAIEPAPPSGPWSEPVMKRDLRRYDRESDG